MNEELIHLSAAVLGVTFAWAGIAKLTRFKAWRAAVAGYRLPEALVPVLSVVVPAAEVGVVALLLAGNLRVGAAVALLLLASFSLAIVRAARPGRSRLPCGCFGGATERDHRSMLARNLVLSALAAVVIVGGGREPLLTALEAPDAGAIAPVILACGGVLLALWVAWQVGSAFRRRESR